MDRVYKVSALPAGRFLQPLGCFFTPILRHYQLEVSSPGIPCITEIFDHRNFPSCRQRVGEGSFPRGCRLAFRGRDPPCRGGPTCTPGALVQGGAVTEEGRGWSPGNAGRGGGQQGRAGQASRAHQPGSEARKVREGKGREGTQHGAEGRQAGLVSVRLHHGEVRGHQEQEGGPHLPAPAARRPALYLGVSAPGFAKLH